MKAIHLNLASKPYRDFAPVYTVAIVAALIAALLMVNNVTVAYRYLVNTRETRDEIISIETATRNEQQAATAVEADLARIDRASLNAQSTYINAQIAERAFSWSQLLDDLEGVIPSDVRLTSLNPTVDPKTADVKLSMNLRGKSDDSLVNLLKAMLADRSFEGTFPHNQTRNEDRTVSFLVSTTYQPALGGSR